MAWDTEKTKRLLLDAGARQFAARGFSGAHMEAIGRDAGVNKERIYQYFGNKQGFFDAVLSDSLGDFFQGSGPVGHGAEAVGDYAVAVFDQLEQYEQLARLLAWESLELAGPANADARALGCAARVDEMQQALPGASSESAAQLLFSIVALAVSSCTLSHAAELILGPAGVQARREHLRLQARALAEAAVAAG